MSSYDIKKLDTDQFYKSEFDVSKEEKEPESDVPASKFAAFLRQKTNENKHLNYFSHNSESTEEEGSQKRTYEKHRIFRFDKLTADETARLLARLILAVQEDIVVMNKPHGISVEDGSGHTRSIQSMLPALGVELGLGANERLHLVHRLDKDTTGLLLMTKSHEMAFRLKDAFKRGLVRKNYLCLVHGIPNPDEGVVDFPLKEGVHNKMTVIKPDMSYVLDRMKKDKGNIGPTNTAYRTLSSNYNISLVQCSMLSGVKHQVRAHMAYGLATPILGDHKYAWLSGQPGQGLILPQQLSGAALAGLKLSPGKTRYLPLHLHAHTITIGHHRLPNKSYDSAEQTLLPGNDIHGCHDNEITHKMSAAGLDSMRFYAELPGFFVERLKLLRIFNMKTIKFALNNIL